MTDSQKILRDLSLSVKNYIKKYNNMQYIKSDDLHFAISSKNGRQICCMFDKSLIEDKIRHQPFDEFLQNLREDLKVGFNVDVSVYDNRIVLYIISLDEFETMIQDDSSMVRELYTKIVSMLEALEEKVKFDVYYDDDVVDDELYFDY